MIIAALTAHHEYDNGSCTSMAPIGVRELHRKYQVGRDATSRFFKHHFTSHATYAATCRRNKIRAWLKLLNHDYHPHPLFGTAPPGEDGDSDD